MKYTFRIILIIWTILMLAVSSIEELHIVPIEMSSADKIMHVVEYAIWAIFFILMMKQESTVLRISAVIKSLLIFGSSLAILDEIHQGFIKGRKCDLVDFLADFIGISIVILIFYIFNKLKNKNEYKIRKKTMQKLRN